MVSAEEFKALFALALKIIRAAQQAKVILISPMYRYVTGRCCRDDSHISNFEEPEFTKRLGNSMQALGKQLAQALEERPGDQPGCTHGDWDCEFPVLGGSRPPAGLPATNVGQGPRPPDRGSV